MGLLDVGRAAREVAERELIGLALAATLGNRAEAARRLDVSYRTLLIKLRAYGFPPARRRSH